MFFTVSVRATVHSYCLWLAEIMSLWWPPVPSFCSWWYTAMHELNCVSFREVFWCKRVPSFLLFIFQPTQITWLNTFAVVLSCVSLLQEQTIIEPNSFLWRQKVAGCLHFWKKIVHWEQVYVMEDTFFQSNIILSIPDNGYYQYLKTSDFKGASHLIRTPTRLVGSRIILRTLRTAGRANWFHCGRG